VYVWPASTLPGTEVNMMAKAELMKLAERRMALRCMLALLRSAGGLTKFREDLEILG
jgi:hypothetical protein